jgi:uncharacterized protein YlxW (UPF0749 family)
MKENKYLAVLKRPDKKILHYIVENPTPKAIFLLLGIVFGVLVAAQWQSLPTRVTNPIAPYTSLKETRDMLSDEQGQLKSAISQDQNKVDSLQQQMKNTGNNKNSLTDLDNQKQIAGLTKLQGPGILAVLADSKQGPTTDESIIHASDLRDVVNLLWGAGAEAISINGERIVTTTSIDCIVNTILVNNTRLSVPFKIQAIGDQKLLLSQIQNKDNLSDLYSRRDQNGLGIDISAVNNLTIDAYSGSFDLKSATY